MHTMFKKPLFGVYSIVGGYVIKRVRYSLQEISLVHWTDRTHSITINAVCLTIEKDSINIVLTIRFSLDSYWRTVDLTHSYVSLYVYLLCYGPGSTPNRRTLWTATLRRRVHRNNSGRVNSYLECVEGGKYIQSYYPRLIFIPMVR